MAFIDRRWHSSLTIRNSLIGIYEMTEDAHEALGEYEIYTFALDTT